MNLEQLKQRLSGLTFAQVDTITATDENIISFRDRHSITVWDDEPIFEQQLAETRASRNGLTDVSYSFYYGFAVDNSGRIHFDSKGHVHDQENYAGLGVFTKQHALTPPRKHSWVVGSVVNPSRPHFHKWARCTEAEKLFAEALLGGKTKFSIEDLTHLCTPRHISDGEFTNHLGSMAMLLLARDLEYFLNYRDRHSTGLDEDVFGLCSDFEEQELWKEYVKGALERVRQHPDRDDFPHFYYSRLIPKPAPAPIIESRSETSAQISVGLNTPFASLKLSA